jgi:hypothetical protein
MIDGTWAFFEEAGEWGDLIDPELIHDHVWEDEE